MQSPASCLQGKEWELTADAISEQFSVCLGTCITHLKAAIDEPCGGGGQVKPSLNLSDGAFHYRTRQGFAEVAEGQSSQKHLGKNSDRK